MIYGERTRRQLHQDSKGLTGTRIILCDWSDVEPVTSAELPWYGDPWLCDDGITIMPFLRVTQIDADEGSAGECEYTVQYSTERELAEEWTDISLDIGLEPGDNADGWEWETAGTPVVDAMPKGAAVGRLSVRMRMDLPPYDVVMDTVDKVNDRIFLGYPAGCMLFAGARADNSYDIDGNIISCSTIFEFLVKAREHNYFWRKPLQALDIDGNPIYWQNIDAAEPYYTTDQGKIATPVWIHETPGQGSNVAGIGDWDKMMKDSAYYYAECDFATVLGIPKAPFDE